MPAQTANAALKRNLSEHEANRCSVLVYTSAAYRGAIVHGEVSRAIYIEARTSSTVPTRKVLHFRSNAPGITSLRWFCPDGRLVPHTASRVCLYRQICWSSDSVRFGTRVVKAME